MNTTKKLMLVAGLFLQISNISADNWSDAIDAFGGIAQIQPKSMSLEQAVRIAKSAGNTPEAQAIGLYVSDKMTKSRFPKAAGDVVAELHKEAQKNPMQQVAMDLNNNNNMNINTIINRSAQEPTAQQQQYIELAKKAEKSLRDAIDSLQPEDKQVVINALHTQNIDVINNNNNNNLNKSRTLGKL